MTVQCGAGLAAATALLCGISSGAHAETLPVRSWTVLVAAQTGGAGQQSGPVDTVPPLPVRKAPGKGAKGAAAEPEPEEWPAEQVKEARARCTRILKQIGAVAVPQPPLKEGKCGTPAPIRLISLGKKARVAFEPAALVNCDLAEALSNWIGDDVQPLAQKHLGARVTKVEVMSDYSCRTAFGRIGHKLSQHAYADALDIRGFVTAKGDRVPVLKTWGETQRDIAKKVMAAAPKAKTARVAGQDATITLPVQRMAAADTLKLAASRLGGPDAAADKGGKDKGTKLATLSPTSLPAATKALAPAPLNRQAKFLRAAHAAACQIFGTTLGPEANEAHRNHFHVDMAKRKAKGYRHLCD